MGTWFSWDTWDTTTEKSLTQHRNEADAVRVAERMRVRKVEHKAITTERRLRQRMDWLERDNTRACPIVKQEWVTRQAGATRGPHRARGRVHRTGPYCIDRGHEAHGCPEVCACGHPCSDPFGSACNNECGCPRWVAPVETGALWFVFRVSATVTTYVPAASEADAKRSLGSNTLMKGPDLAAWQKHVDGLVGAARRITRQALCEELLR